MNPKIRNKADENDSDSKELISFSTPQCGDKLPEFSLRMLLKKSIESVVHRICLAVSQIEGFWFCALLFSRFVPLLPTGDVLRSHAGTREYF